MRNTRMSWTTKEKRALVCDTIEEAHRMACAMLGFKRAISAKLFFSTSQHGYVIFNEAGTKMIADR